MKSKEVRLLVAGLNKMLRRCLDTNGRMPDVVRLERRGISYSCHVEWWKPTAAGKSEKDVAPEDCVL